MGDQDKRGQIFIYALKSRTDICTIQQTSQVAFPIGPVTELTRSQYHLPWMNAAHPFAQYIFSFHHIPITAECHEAMWIQSFPNALN